MYRQYGATLTRMCPENLSLLRRAHKRRSRSSKSLEWQIFVSWRKAVILIQWLERFRISHKYVGFRPHLRHCPRPCLPPAVPLAATTSISHMINRPSTMSLIRLYFFFNNFSILHQGPSENQGWQVRSTLFSLMARTKSVLYADERYNACAVTCTEQWASLLSDILYILTIMSCESQKSTIFMTFNQYNHIANGWFTNFPLAQ